MKKEDFDFIEALFWSCYYRADGMYCEGKAKELWSELKKLQLTSDNSQSTPCCKQCVSNKAQQRTSE